MPGEENFISIIYIKHLDILEILIILLLKVNWLFQLKLKVDNKYNTKIVINILKKMNLRNSVGGGWFKEIK